MYLISIYLSLSISVCLLLCLTGCRDAKPDLVVAYDSTLKEIAAPLQHNFARKYPNLKVRYLICEAKLMIQKVKYGERCDVLLAPTFPIDLKQRNFIAAKTPFGNDQIAFVSHRESPLISHDLAYNPVCIALPNDNSALSYFVQKFILANHRLVSACQLPIHEPGLLETYVQRKIVPAGLTTYSAAKRKNLKILQTYSPNESFYHAYRFETAAPTTLAFTNFLFSLPAQKILSDFYIEPR